MSITISKYSKHMSCAIDIELTVEFDRVIVD